MTFLHTWSNCKNSAIFNVWPWKWMSVRLTIWLTVDISHLLTCKRMSKNYPSMLNNSWSITKNNEISPCLTLKLKVKQIEDLAETDRQTSINMHKADKNDASRSSRLFPVRSEWRNIHTTCIMILHHATLLDRCTNWNLWITSSQIGLKQVGKAVHSKLLQEV